jgi:hypothetical protein
MILSFFGTVSKKENSQPKRKSYEEETTQDAQMIPPEDLIIPLEVSV